MNSIGDVSLKRWGLWGLVILVLAIIGAIFSCTPPGAISRLDLIAYVSGYEVFTHGGNPYSSQELFAKQREWSVARDFVVSMWNPPIFFVYFAPILAAPLSIVGDVARSVSVVCALLLALLGWRVGGGKSRAISVPFLLLGAYGLLPFWEELRLAQNTSWVSLCVALGSSLLLRSRLPYVSGSLLAVALCKPHDFYLVLGLLSLHVMRTRQVKVVIGAVVSVFVIAMLVEFVNPGIWMKWLNRDQWPYVAYGANLTTVLQLTVLDPSAKVSLSVAILSSMVGGLVWMRGTAACGFTSFVDKVMWAWLVTPFFAPYGFFSDQVTLIFPFSYFVSRMVAEEGVSARTRFLQRFCVLSVMCLALSLLPSSPIPVSWMLYAPALVSLIFVSFRSATSKS